VPLEWHSRQKIAVGAARGLRYLHEDCRVGCIVHRDLRPNNILLTHDFEPLVWRIYCQFLAILNYHKLADNYLRLQHHNTTRSVTDKMILLSVSLLSSKYGYGINVVYLFQVGDFGLARWQPDGDCGVDTRVIGTFGYKFILCTCHHEGGLESVLQIWLMFIFKDGG